MRTHAQKVSEAKRRQQIYHQPVCFFCGRAKEHHGRDHRYIPDHTLFGPEDGPRDTRFREDRS